MKQKKSFLIGLSNAFWILLDIFLICLFLAFLVFFIGSFVFLIRELISPSNPCNPYEKLNFLVTLLSLSLTGVLIPIISSVISTTNSNKGIEDDIEGMLARVNHVSLYLVTFPLGIWQDLSSAYQREIIAKYQSNMALSDYSFALHLFFEGEAFQAYDLNLLSIGCCCDSDVDAKTYCSHQGDCTKVIFDNTYGHYVSSDGTGVEGAESRGTNITVLFNKTHDCISSQLLNPTCQHKICFNIEFKKREDKFGFKWAQFSQCQFPFPIIRFVLAALFRGKRRYRFTRLSLCLNGRQVTDERDAQFKFNIYDVDVEKKRAKFPIGKKKWELNFYKNGREKNKTFPTLDKAMRYVRKHKMKEPVRVKYLDGSEKMLNSSEIL